MFDILSLLVVIVFFIVNLGLIIAIFQMNSRLGRMLDKQDELYRLQRIQLVVDLAGRDAGPETVTMLIEHGYLNETQAAWIAAQKTADAA